MSNTKGDAMTPRQKELRKAEIIAWIKSQGYTEDRYGNFKIVWNSGEYRYKLNKNKLRYETRCDKVWFRISSGFWKDLTIENNKIVGMHQ